MQLPVFRQKSVSECLVYDSAGALKMQDMKMKDQTARHENAGHENEGPSSKA